MTLLGVGHDEPRWAAAALRIIADEQGTAGSPVFRPTYSRSPDSPCRPGLESRCKRIGDYSWPTGQLDCPHPPRPASLTESRPFSSNVADRQVRPLSIRIQSHCTWRSPSYSDKRRVLAARAPIGVGFTLIEVLVRNGPRSNSHDWRRSDDGRAGVGAIAKQREMIDVRETCPRSRRNTLIGT